MSSFDKDFDHPAETSSVIDGTGTLNVGGTMVRVHIAKNTFGEYVLRDDAGCPTVVDENGDEAGIKLAVDLADTDSVRLVKNDQGQYVFRTGDDRPLLVDEAGKETSVNVQVGAADDD